MITTLKDEDGKVMKIKVKKVYMLIDKKDAEKIEGKNIVLIQGYCAVFINKKMTRVHRLITNCPDGMQVDHINGDPLDNRRSNLRVCTTAQNGWNRKQNKKKPKCEYPYKGICFRKKSRSESKMWDSRICVNGKRISLGIHATPELAAKAYDEAARKFYGEFAKTNFN